VAHVGRSQWLERRRDFFVRNVVRDFLRSMSFLFEIRDRHDGERISYERLEEWIGTKTHRGTLWLLKDRCHRLWNGMDSSEQSEAFLFDWMVGAIFHEAMKLKENVYLVERYQPAYVLAMSSSRAGRQESSYEEFFNQTLQEIDSGIEKLQYLFSQATDHLKCMILKERNNTLLLKFLLEVRTAKGEFLQKAIDIEELLDILFPEGLQEAYCVAGESYLEGSWYAEARMAFEEAVRIDTGCANAYTGLEILKKRIEEVTLMLEREYASTCIKNDPAQYQPNCLAQKRIAAHNHPVSLEQKSILEQRSIEPGIAQHHKT
jgi:hypothetical protein